MRSMLWKYCAYICQACCTKIKSCFLFYFSKILKFSLKSFSLVFFPIVSEHFGFISLPRISIIFNSGNLDSRKWCLALWTGMVMYSWKSAHWSWSRLRFKEGSLPLIMSRFRHLTKSNVLVFSAVQLCLTGR